MGRNKRRSARGGRGRIQSAADALDQLVSIEHAQLMRRTKRTKQIIDSTDKSRRRFVSKLNALESADEQEVKDAFEE
jgi:hypothetical protein